MSREESLKEVPSDDVGKIVQSFIDSGAKYVCATKNGSKTWDVTARF